MVLLGSLVAEEVNKYFFSIPFIPYNPCSI